MLAYVRVHCRRLRLLVASWHQGIRLLALMKGVDLTSHQTVMNTAKRLMTSCRALQLAMQGWETHLYKTGGLLHHGRDAQCQALTAGSFPYRPLHSLCQQGQVLPVASTLHLRQHIWDPGRVCCSLRGPSELRSWELSGRLGM